MGAPLAAGVVNAAGAGVVSGLVRGMGAVTTAQLVLWLGVGANLHLVRGGGDKPWCWGRGQVPGNHAKNQRHACVHACRVAGSPVPNPSHPLLCPPSSQVAELGPAVLAELLFGMGPGFLLALTAELAVQLVGMLLGSMQGAPRDGLSGGSSSGGVGVGVGVGGDRVRNAERRSAAALGAAQGTAASGNVRVE
jgi:hypothetical protein